MTADRPENFITSGSMGIMGFVLPAAIFGHTSHTDDMVIYITITGDGSIMINIWELTTLKRKQLPIKKAPCQHFTQESETLSVYILSLTSKKMSGPWFHQGHRMKLCWRINYAITSNDHYHPLPC